MNEPLRRLLTALGHDPSTHTVVRAVDHEKGPGLRVTRDGREVRFYKFRTLENLRRDHEWIAAYAGHVR